MREIKLKCSGSFLLPSHLGLRVKLAAEHLTFIRQILSPCYKEQNETFFSHTPTIRQTDRTTTCSRRLSPPLFPDLSIYRNGYILVRVPVGHHFISLLSTVSLVRPVEVTGRCGGGGTWQMVQGHGSPAQCWKPEPS